MKKNRNIDRKATIKEDVVVDDIGHVTHVTEVQKKPEKASVNIKNSTEIGGRKGLEPTRYGDWEKNGRCIDF